MQSEYLEDRQPNQWPKSAHRFAAFTAAASPVLGIYSSGIPGLALLDIIVAPLTISLLILNRKIHKSAIFVLAAFIFFSLASILIIAANNDNLFWGPFITRSSKYLLYIIFIGLIAIKMDWDTFLRSLNYIGAVAYFGTLFQFVFIQMTGNFIALWIPFMELVGNRTALELIQIQMSLQRPPSIFLEPAHLGYFLSIHFITLLYMGKMKPIYWLAFLIITLISTSSYAAFLFAFITFFYAFQLLRKYSSPSVAVFALVFFIAFFLSASLDLLAGVYAVQRLLEPESVALVGRTQAGRSQVEALEGLQIFFGRGFGNMEESTYMNFLYFTIYSFGWVGFSFIVATWIVLLIFERGRRFMAILILFPLSIASPVLYSYYVIPFVLLILAGPKHRIRLMMGSTQKQS